MTPTFDSMADLSIEQRNAALVSWLNDLTTVYEKCAAERGALRAENEQLRWAYFAFVDDTDYETPCDEYDPGGEGTIMHDGYPQCAACGHPFVVHAEQDRARFLAEAAHA